MFSKKVTIKIGGMHCEHCSLRIKEALEKIDNVSHVKVSLKEGKVTLSYKKEIDLDTIQKIIEGEEFEYLGVDE